MLTAEAVIDPMEYTNIKNIKIWNIEFRPLSVRVQVFASLLSFAFWKCPLLLISYNQLNASQHYTTLELLDLQHHHPTNFGGTLHLFRCVGERALIDLITVKPEMTTRNIILEDK